MRWRHLWGPVLMALAMVLLDPLRSPAHAEPGVPVPPGELITDTNDGEITAADKDLVVKVRLAGLWEIPAGQMAQEKSRNPRIRQIGKSIADQHVVLDRLDRVAARKLGIKVPDKPNADQQGWLGEMRDAEGEEFDRIYIDRLRAAHGKIFPAIATIRSSTRNDTVRKLAQQANQFVATHMTLLESSGIVDFQALPTAPPPAPATSAAVEPAALSQASGNQAGGTQAGAAPAGGTNQGLVIGVFAAALAAGAFFTWRTTSARRRPRRRRYHY